MRTLEHKPSSSAKLLKADDACRRYSMCRNSLVRAAEDAQAIVRFGRSVFFNVGKLDAYFDSLSAD
jgi:hypothetical protein